MKFYFLLLSLLFLNICNSQAQTKSNDIFDSLIKNNDYKTAIKYYEVQLKKTPKSEDALRSIGRLYLYENNFEKAINYYNQALLINPTCANCYRNLAIAYGKNYDNAMAFKNIEKAIALQPKEAIFLITKAEIFTADKKPKEAKATYNAAVQLEPKNTQILLARFKYYQAIGDNLKALDDIDAAINLEPKNESLYFERASFYYEAKLTKEALDDMNKAISLNDKNDNFYLGRGAVFAVLNNVDSAALDYQKAIYINPANYSAYFNLYQLEYQKENMDKSCDYLTQTIAVAKAAKVDTNLINVYKINYDDACNKNLANYYFQRGIANFNLKKYQEAIKYYQEGLVAFPKNNLIMTFLGNAYMALQQFDNAIEQLKRSVESTEALDKSILENPSYANLSQDSLKLLRNAYIAETYKSLSICYKNTNSGEALMYINKAIQLLVPNPEVMPDSYYALRSEIYNDLRNYIDAKKDIDKAIVLNNKIPDHYVYRAVINYNMAQKNPSTTEITKVRTISFGVNNKNGFNKQATFTLPTKTKLVDNLNLIAVINDCNKAASITNSIPGIYLFRGLAKMQLGQKDYCLDIFKAKSMGLVIDDAILASCK